MCFDVSNIGRCSSKENKLRYVDTIRGAKRESLSRNGKFTVSKTKPSRLIIIIFL